MLNKFDLVEGMILKSIMSCADVPVTFEALISKNLTTINNKITNNPILLSSSEENNTASSAETVSNPLISVAVVLNVNASHSLYFFRNAMSLFYDTDQLAVRTKWQIGKRSLVIDIIVIDPQGQISLPVPFEIGSTNETVLIPLPLLKSTTRRIPTGLWQLQIFDIENLLAELKFYILPTRNTFNTTFAQAESNNVAKWYDILSKFYFIRDMCVSNRHATNYKRYCRCQKVRLPTCEFGTTWSSAKKDLKSDAIEMLL
uniref:Uncharacterized protein n=1 Tax=Romanomermis culicivorax TaxID=13658 RepID=A0A915KVH4_ROMCU